MYFDAGIGRTIGRRPVAESMYRGAIANLPASTGVILLHDGSFGLSGLRGARAVAPRSGVYLYSHIPVSRSVARRELRSTLGVADGVIVVSSFMAERLASRLGVSGPMISVVHNAVDVETFRPRDALAEPTRRILWIGKASPEKGAHHVMNALRLVKASDWSLTVVGASWFVKGQPLSPYEQKLRDLARGLTGQVTFTGFVDHQELPELMRRHDIFCFPSDFDEPFGLALLEAMASGLACIASPRGGIPEVGGDAVQFARPGDDVAWASVIDELLDDDVARVQWSRAARDRALTFSYHHQFDSLMGVIGRHL